jgi:hypothetical protein
VIRAKLVAEKRYSPDSHNVNIKAEESPLLEAVIRGRLVKTKQAGKDLACAGAFVKCGNQRWRYN